AARTTTNARRRSRRRWCWRPRASPSKRPRMRDKRLRILTWHVHGNYLYYLTQVPHEFWLVTDPARTPHHSGRSGRLPWGGTAHGAAAAPTRERGSDVTLSRARTGGDEEHPPPLGGARRAPPRISPEPAPPQEHPTNTRHWVDDPHTLLVHVTPFNALMW